MRRRYKVLMDWWVAVLAIIFLSLFVVAVPLLFHSDLTWWKIALTAAFAVGAVLYLVDILFFTYYSLEEEGLVITSQLRHFLFPYRSMTRIRQGNIMGLVSFGHRRRFALSAHCYYIDLENQEWRVISISPRQRDIFINQLLQNIDKERSKRATVDASRKIA